MTHTPGPWTIDHRNHCYSIRPVGTGFLLATVREEWLERGCFKSDKVAGQEHQANAHLIAEAPDMLALLEWFIPNVEYLAAGRAEVLDKVECAKTVVAKAKGETP